MAELINVPLIDPKPSTTYCTAGGQRRYYTDWRLPDTITRALGVGCIGGLFGAFDGERPVAECIRLGSALVAVRVRTEKVVSQ